MSGRSQQVQSVRRAISILRSFSIESPELGVTEISHRTGLHKSTAFRLLETLEAEGLISQDPETGRFRLGVGLIALAGRVLEYMDLRQASRRHMRILADRTGETVNLAILDEGSSLNLEQSLPHGRLVKNYGWIGRRTPIHATSTGKVLLAWLSESERQSILQRPLERFTPNTIVEVQELELALEEVRRLGYAVGHEEYEVGLNAVAAPVRNHEGQVVAALSISGPAYRLAPETFETSGHAVMRVASEISRHMGHEDIAAVAQAGGG